ncbi:MAG: hypothetical protein PG978_000980 [Wolbachia endosymbiont of Ctenocephalides felis wCfeF]|nr:MAG: hypothetical protein PG978_000980 [Wolbachia endosymbiont of Ctenocephalides felis wCfeF]
MWQSIKKFFKRIADCTGISWIARKISSGWNSVKNWWSGNKVSDIDPSKAETPEEPSIPNEPSPEKPEPVIDSIYEKEGKLVLALSIETAQKVFGFTSLENMKEYCAKITSSESEYYIAGSKLTGINDQSCSFLFSIDKMAYEDTELDNIAKAKEKLGLNNTTKEAEVNYIRAGHYEFTSKVITNNNTPNSETTSPGVQPHTTGNDRSVNA